MKLFRKMADQVRSFWVSDPKAGQILQRSSTSDAGEIVTETNVLGISAVWACANLLSGTTASLPLMLYRTSASGERTPARDHTLYQVLHDSPNYDQTALDFWEFVSASLELWGNAYARKIRGTMGQITALVPISPNLISSVRRLSSGAIEYRWTDNGKSYVALDEDMFHIRGFGGNPLGGMSPLAFGRDTFGVARAAARAASTVYANGMRPSGVLTFDEFLTPEQREIAETRMADRFMGSQNAGRPMVLEGGTKWTPLTMNPEDAQLVESQQHSVEEICRIFGVPPFMIGHSGDATEWGTGLEQQVLAFVKFTLRRRLRRIEMAVAKQLLTAKDRADGIVVEFNMEGLLSADSKGRTEFYQSALTNGWMTINEVRRLENMPPVAGGDVPRMQMQNVPITEAGKAAV